MKLNQAQLLLSGQVNSEVARYKDQLTIPYLSLIKFYAFRG